MNEGIAVVRYGIVDQRYGIFPEAKPIRSKKKRHKKKWLKKNTGLITYRFHSYGDSIIYGM